jgi:shikimate kinase
MKTSLALIGFMGAGKSVVGACLAQKLGKTFIELDALISRQAGKPLPRIFEEEGESGFREREIDAVKQIAVCGNQVIACGGGVVLNWINIERLKLNCLVVWLSPSLSVIMQRTGLDGTHRPLLKNIRSAEELHAMLKFRQPFYQRAADIKVNTSRLTVEAVVEQVLLKLKSYANNN